MKRLTILIFLFTNLYIYASHIVGGEIYYDYLGNNDYKISIVLYRDCNSTGALYDDPLSLGIFNDNKVLLYNIPVTFPGSTNIPITFSNPCVTPPNDICIEKGVYSKIINLPPIIGGYHLSYQRCCRGPNVVNINNPDNTGLTLTAHIPGIETNLTNNSSPRFTGYPPTLLCAGEELVFNHSAIDLEGDELVYSLEAPYSGANSEVPMPSPPPSQPYNQVVWKTNYQSTNPLGPNSTISINSITGILTVTPSQTGLFVVGIRVTEYRNGVVIGYTTRDFLFRVIDCQITLKAEIPLQEEMNYFISYCQGLTVTFDNNSFGATNYNWDFGVTSTNSDVSTQFEPTYTYPQPGTYQVRLIANLGWPCSDTSYQSITVNNQLETFFTTTDSICFIGNTFDFDGTIIGNQTTDILYTFGNNASIPSSTNLDVSSVTFNTTGFIPITLEAKSGTCESKFTDSIYIFALPQVDFSPPINYMCEGLTVSFTNNSTDIISSDWDFGVMNTNSDKSSSRDPIFNFPSPGTYTVKLIGKSTGQCIDSTFKTLIVNEVLDVSFSSQDTLCITNNIFDFDGDWTGSSQTTFLWDFGSKASSQTSNNIDVFNISYSEPGKYPVTLTGNFMNCSDSFTDTVFILREPEVDFTILDELHCSPYLAHFIDLSLSDAPLNYFWDFGNGLTSNIQNPTSIYENVGEYSVSLKIVADYGCIDTISLSKSDFIEVHPKPTADFSVSKEETDICNSMISFFDASLGAETFTYIFNGIDSTNEQNPTYVYLQPNTFYPVQIVTNEYGCKDTLRKRIYIIPFNVFIPNAFTPNGNEYNNDFFTVTNLIPENWDFSIFNRWGERIYNTQNPYDRWDGNYNGTPVQSGLYIYKLNYTSCDALKSEIEITGHVSLLK